MTVCQCRETDLEWEHEFPLKKRAECPHGLIWFRSPYLMVTLPKERGVQ